jgi:hypothetical protein
MAMYYGTGPEFQKGAYNNQGIWVPERDGNGNNIYLNPDQKIELQVTPNGGYIIIAKDKTGATERREVITRESITNYLYGYPEDRFTAFLAQTGKLRIGDLEINLRAEEGMKPFTKKEKEAIVNAYLSSNIPGMEWTKSISKSAFESTKAYLILNFEDIFRRSRSISGGVGVTGTLTMPKVSFGLTGQVIEEYTPMMEKQWTTIPSINLTHTQILGQHFELYNSATVRYDIAEEKLKGTLSTGAAWKISEYWRIGGSGDWNWGPIDIWTANASIAYRKIKLEGSLSIQEDKLYGTNKFFNTRIVPSGQAKLIYDLGSTRRLGRK